MEPAPAAELPVVAEGGLPWALGVQANGVVKVHFEREWLSRSPADREVAAAVEHAFRNTCTFDIPPDYQVSIAPVNPFAEAGLQSDTLRQFIQQRGFFMLHIKRGADPLFVSAHDHDYRRMEDLMQELDEEKRARRKLEWELVEETEARTEQERQLHAERSHNNLLRQRIAELEEQMGAALRGARQAVSALDEGLAISATSLSWSGVPARPTTSGGSKPGGAGGQQQQQHSGRGGKGRKGHK